jgi:hypothetical protein
MATNYHIPKRMAAKLLHPTEKRLLWVFVGTGGRLLSKPLNRPLNVPYLGQYDLSSSACPHLTVVHEGKTHIEANSEMQFTLQAAHISRLFLPPHSTPPGW